MAEMTVDERNKIKQTFHDKLIWTRFGMIVLGFWLLTSPETFGYVQKIKERVERYNE